MTVEQIVTFLRLEPLVEEGGWFRRTRTEGKEDGRPTMTCIYALFTREQFSALHRLDAAETLFFHSGDPFEILELGPDGSVQLGLLGSNVGAGETPQRAFAKGIWFGGKPKKNGRNGYSLMSAVVSPGFEWEGFELGKRKELVGLYPDCVSEIVSLTRA